MVAAPDGILFFPILIKKISRTYREIRELGKIDKFYKGKEDRVKLNTLTRVRLAKYKKKANKDFSFNI